jgi:hypothetical protein
MADCALCAADSDDFEFVAKCRVFLHIRNYESASIPIGVVGCQPVDFGQMEHRGKEIMA